MNIVRYLLLLLALTATCSFDVATGQRNAWKIIAGAAGLLTIGALAGGALGFVAGANKRPTSFGFGRRRRAVTDQNLSRRIDDMIDISAIMDESGCAARLLCELHQRPFDQLDQVQRSLVQLFDGKTIPVYEQLSQPKAAFQYAAFVGSSRPKDLKVCSRTFPKCPMNADAILKSLQ